MTIETCRKQIDTIDTEILDLLERRADVVRQIVAIKVKAGIPVVDPERERIVIKRAFQANRAKGASSARIYRQIIRESRNLQMAMIGETAAEVI